MADPAIRTGGPARSPPSADPPLALPPALEEVDGVLLVHPESIGKQVNLRLWFGAFVVWMTALTIAARTSQPFTEASLTGYRVSLVACMGFYLSLACTFVPIPTSPVIALAAVPAVNLAADLWTRLFLVAATGAACTTMANLNDYHLWTFVLRLRKVAAVRQTRLYRAAIRWFSQAPWWTMVAFSLIPIPVDLVRLLAITFQYPRWRFATACFVGRFARYGILVWMVGSLARIPGAQWWVVLAVTVLTVAVGLTFGLPRLVRLARGPNRPRPARSDRVE